MDTVVARIVHVFADALPHVPEHRRLPILTQLVTTLGPARFLWVLMLLLFKLHATQTASCGGGKVNTLLLSSWWEKYLDKYTVVDRNCWNTCNTEEVQLVLLVIK